MNQNEGTTTEGSDALLVVDSGTMCSPLGSISLDSLESFRDQLSVPNPHISVQPTSLGLTIKVWWIHAGRKYSASYIPGDASCGDWWAEEFAELINADWQEMLVFDRWEIWGPIPLPEGA